MFIVLLRTAHPLIHDRLCMQRVLSGGWTYGCNGDCHVLRVGSESSSISYEDQGAIDFVEQHVPWASTSPAQLLI